MGMSKYNRLLHILNLLRSRRNLNAERLAQECGVTERTIYRDMIALSEANIPLYYDRGYKLASDIFLPPLNLEFDEYTFLKLALESTPLTRTDKYSTVAKKIRAKIEAGLSKSVRSQKRFMPTTSIELPHSVKSSSSTRFFGTIETAISEARCFDLSYDSIQSGETHRVIEPYFLVFRRNAFYFVGYCRLRGEIRTFRIDRILSMELMSERFIRPSDITAATYFADSWGVFGGKSVEVTVRFTGTAAKVVTSTPHHPKERISSKRADGSVTYRVITTGLEEIGRWILGFGSEAEVLEPEELREQLAGLGFYLCEKYGSPGNACGS